MGTDLKLKRYSECQLPSHDAKLENTTPIMTLLYSYISKRAPFLPPHSMLKWLNWNLSGIGSSSQRHKKRRIRQQYRSFTQFIPLPHIYAERAEWQTALHSVNPKTVVSHQSRLFSPYFDVIPFRTLLCCKGLKIYSKYESGPINLSDIENNLFNNNIFALFLNSIPFHAYPLGVLELSSPQYFFLYCKIHMYEVWIKIYIYYVSCFHAYTYKNKN